jgi:hypothetical protein
MEVQRAFLRLQIAQANTKIFRSPSGEFKLDKSVEAGILLQHVMYVYLTMGLRNDVETYGGECRYASESPPE